MRKREVSGLKDTIVVRLLETIFQPSALSLGDLDLSVPRKSVKHVSFEYFPQCPLYIPVSQAVDEGVQHRATTVYITGRRLGPFHSEGDDGGHK